jgi:hypothetical protein
MSKKEEPMYLVNIFDGMELLDQHVLTLDEAGECAEANERMGLVAMVMKITRALSVNEEGIIVC